jgi:hypothetical protein
MGEIEDKKKKKKEHELQKEFEEIEGKEHTAEEHAKECSADVEELVKEIEEKEEEPPEEEEKEEEE